ncbi:MAG: hypothetical protein P1S60_20280, partial [Anaerolineae bacterium]|nr:hypothetical protein [Anaerolineae bacterium]
MFPLLYLVIRSPTTPFGPTDMRTWEGFLRHATAQGLRVNLFHYGLADLPQRWIVFITLLQLQYAVPFILCLLIGVFVFIKHHLKEGVLVGLFIFGHLAFTLNSVQDVMAYLLHIFMALAIPIACGFTVILNWWHRRIRGFGFYALEFGAVVLVALTALLRLPRISLHNWLAPEVTFAQLVDRFQDKETHASYVSDWEHLTPYFYKTLVEGSAFSREDLNPVYVTGGLPWEQAVFNNLPNGPVYLSNYRREIRELGFRLRPAEHMWQVLEPPAFQPVNPQYFLDDARISDGVQIIGYDLPGDAVSPGDVIPLTLYLSSDVVQNEILMPYVTLGSIEQHWTTDSRRLTPDWIPNEIIVERYHVYIPYTIEPGTYRIRLGFTNASNANTDIYFTNGEKWINLVDIKVNPENILPLPISTNHLMTNIGNDVGLVNVSARSGWQTRFGSWTKPLVINQGQT